MQRFFIAIALSLAGLLFWGGVLNKLYVNLLLPSLCTEAELNTVIFGDSHGEQIEFPNSLNFSGSGDPVKFQHQCFKTAYAKFEGLERVIISVGPHDFSAYKSKRLRDRNSNWLRGNSKRIYAFWNDKEDLNLAIALAYIEGAMRFFTLDDLISARMWGVQSDLGENSLKETLNRHGVSDANWFDKSNIVLFERFIQSVKENEIDDVWVIGTPLHKEYRKQIGKHGWMEYKKGLELLSRSHSVHYLSLEESFLPDSCYKDSDHLNEYGQSWLADTLDTIIKKASASHQTAKLFH